MREAQLIGTYRPRPRLRWSILPWRYLEEIVAYNRRYHAWNNARRKELGLPRLRPSARYDDPDLQRAMERLNILSDSLGVMETQWSAEEPRLIDVTVRRHRPRKVRRLEAACRPIAVRVIEARSSDLHSPF